MSKDKSAEHTPLMKQNGRSGILWENPFVQQRNPMLLSCGKG
ncbi:hypothetical protein [Stenotrophomonas indicatrix]|nr:hypothetical protein [Stenotrophomonas indicatrix]